MALKPSLREVLSLLREQGTVPPDTEPRAMTAMESFWRSAAATPWYVRVLIGFGAWVAACFLCVFFGMLLDFRKLEGLFFVGLVLCGGTTGLRYLSSQIFLSQLLLAFCLTGQALFLVGLAGLSDNETATALGFLLLELALLALYPDRTLRFLATVGGAMALLFLGYKSRQLALVDLTLAGFAALVHWLLLSQARLQRGPLRTIVSPASFALAVVFFGALLLRGFLAVSTQFREKLGDSPIAVLTLGLALVTMYTAARCLRRRASRSAGPRERRCSPRWASPPCSP